MNRFQKLYILLPCHSLEDFPVHHTGNDAQSLLENWIAPWHPDLIASSETAPKWHRAEECPESLENSLVLVPTVSEPSLPDTLASNCESAQSLLLVGSSNREQIVEQALQHIGLNAKCSQDSIADFFALGYAYLQVQLMTRQLRYSSNLDEEKFEETVVAAASTCQQSDESFTEKLQACFDLLLEEKTRYYPVEANLVDLTLIADTTLGKSLRNQLQREFRQNVLITGQQCQKLAEKNPETLTKLKQRIADQRVEIVGGNHCELPDPLLCSETIIRNLELGRNSCNKILETRPSVYARRTTGLTPSLPEILEKMRFFGVLHSSLDEGRLPSGMASNTRWEAPSGESMSAITRPPFDASQASSFVDLGIRIGEIIDSEHYATVVFAHWPDQLAPAFEDLVRIHRFGPLLGNFVSFTEHFESVYDPGYGECHKATDYSNAYLKKAVQEKQSDPISRFVRYWNRVWRLRELESLTLIAAVHQSSADESRSIRIKELAARTDNDIIENDDSEIDVAIKSELDQITQSFTTPSDNSTLINTLNFPRTVTHRSKKTAKPSSESGNVYLRDSSGGQSVWVVKCPPMGNCQLDPAEQSKKTKLGPPVLSENILQNEFFRLRVDPQTGGIRNLNVYERRTNLLTQRLAMRQFSGHPNLDKPKYGQMVANKLESKQITQLTGQITSYGNLLLDQKVVAEFQQSLSVTRGSRIIDFEIEIDSLNNLDGETGWDNYLCSRIAWAEANADLKRELHFKKYKSQEKRLCAPGYIEIDDHETKLTLITGGLPYHQRSGERQLDSILVCAGETARKFKFAIAVNSRYSSQTMASWYTPPRVLEKTKLSSQSSNWLFHFSSKNIIVISAVVLTDSNNRTCGVRFRLQETEGRRGDLKIHCPYPIQKRGTSRLFRCKNGAVKDG